MKHRGAIPEWVGYPLMAIYISLFAGWNVVAEWATSGIALPAVLILSGVRALTAAALMFIFYLLRTNCSRGTPLCPPLPHLKRIAITGVLRSFTSVFFGIGLSMAGSVNASVFHSIVPGITALVAVMMGYEQLRWRRIGGVATAMVGALIVLGAEELFQGAKRTLGPGVDNDALAYAPKDDLSRSSPQSHAITLTGVSSHDLHFSRAHVGLLMLFGYCTTYTAYYILMHALTRLKPAGSTASATPTARTDEEDNYNASTDDNASDDEEAAGVVAADEVTPPSNAVSAEQHYAADHMMALLQLASGTATMLVLALFAVAGAVAPADLAQCWSWSFGVAVVYGSIGLSVFAYLAEMVAIRLVGAAMTSLSIALDPPMTLIFGAIFLKKGLNPYILPGIILIAIGIVVSALSKDSKKAIAPTPGVAVVELSTRGVHRAARNN